MPEISSKDLKKMRNSFRLDVAKHLAAKAQERSLVTYGELTEEFGGIDRGWGNTLGGIALRCHDAELPCLSVIVVSKGTGQPSVDALLYKDLGLSSPSEIEAEQQRCFDQNWKSTPLG
ncbi:hypothetical protein [Mesorhizobium sp. M1342]|uniref:hypothetical protein n=1 Tax=Mesorhizobium sp. M1342 TaxID=2957088 RepID=UPI00333CE790